MLRSCPVARQKAISSSCHRAGGVVNQLTSSNHAERLHTASFKRVFTGREREASTAIKHSVQSH